MAVEKLHELVTSGRFDRVVVDTPPAQHVVDFFRAPERIRSILDRSLMKGLLEGGGGLRAAATRSTLGLVERIAGDGVMGDIREFFALVGEISPGIRQRSAAVATLLRAESTRYWLVSDADAPERNDLLGFLDELRAQGMRFAGFLVNRVQAVPSGPFPTEQALLDASDAPGWSAAAAVLAALPESARARALAHRQAARQLVKQAGGAPVWLVPEVLGGITSLDGLATLSPHLPPSPPTTL
jgi:anion-transporting  ArsA/GET3 family ATPase